MRDMSLRNFLPFAAELLKVKFDVTWTAVLFLTCCFCACRLTASLDCKDTESSAGFL